MFWKRDRCVAIIRIPQEKIFPRVFAVLVCSFALAGSSMLAQQPPQPQPQRPRSARESAQVDLTGYWVPLITEDWLYRVVTPPKGDTTSVPLNAEGIKSAKTWDLAKDEANGEQCKPYGAPGVMRLPLRVQITWADDNTLKIETDSGQQTRLFHFDKTRQPGTQRTLQGHSIAEWTRPAGGPNPLAFLGAPAGRGSAAAGPPRGSLKVVTRNLRSGYLRKNGVPYSERTVLTEYYARVSAFGNDYMTVMTVVDDPTYLSTPFLTTTHFKREPDGSRWKPAPCKTDPPSAANRPEGRP
jgi:hypothetical protein